MKWRRKPQGLAAYTDMKVARATAAHLPPYTTDADHHGDCGLLDAVGNEWTRRLFDGDFYLSPVPDAQLPGCSLTFVQSRDGNTAAPAPSELGGGDTDQHLIYEGLSRVAADGVLCGAETIRRADLLFSVWHPELVRLRDSLGKPRHPAQIVATLRGLNVEHGLLFNTPPIPVILLTLESRIRGMQDAVSARPWIRMIGMPTRNDLPSAFAELRRRGIARISAIGGRHLAASLVDAGLVQDVYLTTSPRDGGEPDTPFYPRPLPARTVVRKHGTGIEEGVVFEHRQLSPAHERDLEQLRP